MADTILDVREVSTTLGGHAIHRDLSLSVTRGEVVALIERQRYRQIGAAARKSSAC